LNAAPNGPYQIGIADRITTYSGSYGHYYAINTGLTVRSSAHANQTTVVISGKLWMRINGGALEPATAGLYEDYWTCFAVSRGMPWISIISGDKLPYSGGYQGARSVMLLPPANTEIGGVGIELTKPPSSGSSVGPVGPVYISYNNSGGAGVTYTEGYEPSVSIPWESYGWIIFDCPGVVSDGAVLSALSPSTNCIYIQLWLGLGGVWRLWRDAPWDSFPVPPAVETLVGEFDQIKLLTGYIINCGANFSINGSIVNDIDLAFDIDAVLIYNTCFRS
jgi:hypothetical protein